MTSFTTGMLYLCRICALPNLLNTEILLFNLVKNGGQRIHEKSNNGYFLTTQWGFDLYTAKYGKCSRQNIY